MRDYRGADSILQYRTALRDERLEVRIHRACEKLIRAGPYQRTWWRLMARLISQRSPEQIHRMERERRLR